MNKTRLEAFSDGVLAIIITIMVLEIKVPHGSAWIELKPLIPVSISYLMSFIYIGIYWGNHHHLLHTVKSISSGMIWANMNLLFWLSLIPFVTGWMGENHFAANTVAVYGAVLLMCGFAFTILQKSVEKHSHDLAALKEAFFHLNRKGLASLLGYIIAIPMAFVHTLISAVFIVAIAVMWLIPDTNLEKALKGEK